MTSPPALWHNCEPSTEWNSFSQQRRFTDKTSQRNIHDSHGLCLKQLGRLLVDCLVQMESQHSSTGKVVTSSLSAYCVGLPGKVASRLEERSNEGLRLGVVDRGTPAGVRQTRTLKPRPPNQRPGRAAFVPTRSPSPSVSVCLYLSLSVSPSPSFVLLVISVVVRCCCCV